MIGFTQIYLLMVVYIETVNIGIIYIVLQRLYIKLFPRTNCPYHGVKVTCFEKKREVLTGEFSTVTLNSLQNNTSNAFGKGSIPGLATYFRFSFRFFKKGSYWRKYVHEVLGSKPAQEKCGQVN